MYLVCYLVLFILSINSQQDTCTIQDLEFNRNIVLANKIKNGEISINHSFRAYQIANELANKHYLAKSCKEISYDFENLGELDSALFYAIKSAEFYENLILPDRVAMMFNRIGTLYFNQGDTILSLKYLEKALTIHYRIGKAIYIGEDLTNTGEIYRMLGRPQEAIKYQQEALQFIDKTEYKSQYAYTLGNLGLAYMALNQQDSANYYLKRSTILLHELGDDFPITVYLSEGAKIALQNGHYEDALENAKQSLELAIKENFKQQIADCYQLISEIQQKTGNYENALLAYQKARELKDSITNIDLVRNMERQRTDFEVSKREETIQALEKVNKLRNTIILIMAIGIVLIALSAFSYFKLYGKLKLVNGELEVKSNAIEEALHEKEALLKEIHHRVKNNLQIISSLLSLQSRQLDDGKAKIAIENSQNRLQSISLIHQKLYQSDNIAYIKAQEYVEQLITELDNAFSKESITISHKLAIENINLNMDVAVPIGLIINELCINAYKYAFLKKDTGIIEISLKKIKDKNNYQLIFKDNGIGLPADFDPLKAKSLGLKLVNILSRQLGGELNYNSSNGSEFILNFNVNNNQQN